MALAPTLSRPLAAGLGLLAAARRARAFHPVGTAARAVVDVDTGDHPLAGLAGRHDAIVRTSRGIGLPTPLPDVLGVALRLLPPGADAEAAGDPSTLDVPMASSAAGRITRHLLRPAIAPQGPTYSSLAPYAGADDRRFVVGVRFAGDQDLDLLVARPGAPWRTVGRVAVGDPLPAAVGEALRFDPFTCPPWMEPVGFVNDLRQPAYRASQARRPTDADAVRRSEATALGDRTT
ncbi:hypothetical protein HC251_05125 [Iamia sp. SCSIO 61187]|uniref:hypothetical protein n=1 Tax=Iamia sp. SCSIO 61187 TaxID=2722752 RepID=UPI001C628D67|nr:hypothetical protein [Iamia sp. SCSIO 61187]QYG91881.1 hypothetical protein HC251_05125 [Iamia sp. SCSIO 61187]